MRELARKFEHCLDGRSPILEDHFLEDDLWTLRHPDGEWCWEETCKICIQKWEEDAERRKRGLHLSWQEMFAKRRVSENSIIPPGIEFWESSLFHYVDDKTWASWWWEILRRWIMEAMEKKLGREQSRKLYHLCFWGVNMFAWDYSKEQIRAWEDLLDGHDRQMWERQYESRVEAAAMK